MHVFRLCFRFTAVFAVSVLANVAGAEQPLFCTSYTDVGAIRASRYSFLETQSPKTRNYTSYYLRHLENYHRPPIQISNYIFDKYYLMNPNLSPYLNLARRNIYGNNYYQRVLPERERRAMAREPERATLLVASTPKSVAITSPIHAPVPVPSTTGVRAAESYKNASRNFNKFSRTRQFDDLSILGAAVVER